MILRQYPSACIPGPAASTNTTRQQSVASNLALLDAPKGCSLAPIIHIVVDRRNWRSFCDQLQELRDVVETSSVYAYIDCPNSLRREAERLCRDLSLDDRVYFLSADEFPPIEAVRWPPRD